MYWVAMALCHDPDLAQDAVQEVFIKLWEEKVDPNTIDRPHSYLAVRVRNQVLDMMRHRSVVTAHEERIRYEIESERLEGLSDEELDRMIHEAWSLVDSLPPSAREIFLMATMEGLKYDEIASRRGISVNTVKTQLRLARKKLRRRTLPLIVLYLILFHT